MRARTKFTMSAVVVLGLAGYGSGHAATKPATKTTTTTTSVTRHGEAQVSGTGETAYIRAVLTDLGAPDTGADVDSVVAWVRHETPSWGQGAANNPLNSTLPEPGATWFNTLSGGLHVQNYPNATVGAAATAATIENGFYPHILADLTSGAGVCGDPAVAAELHTWSGGFYDNVCD